jgi:hypothetical protein
MARIIELTGPPGVGKTTYHDILVSKWEKSCSWVPAHFLYPKQRIRFDSVKNFAQSLFQRVNRNVDTDAFDEAGKRFVARYPEYADAIFRDISENKHDVYGRDLRLHETSFFYNSFKWMQLLLEAPTEKYALKAEGIIHRIPHSIMYDDLEKDRRIAVSLITKIPMPAAVIYLTCDMEENAKRLVTRKFVWDGHRNLSLTKLKEYSRRSHEKRNMIIDVLQDHRVPILKVDTTEGLAKSTERILAFINSL